MEIIFYIINKFGANNVILHILSIYQLSHHKKCHNPQGTPLQRHSGRAGTWYLLLCICSDVATGEDLTSYYTTCTILTGDSTGHNG